MNMEDISKSEQLHILPYAIDSLYMFLIYAKKLTKEQAKAKIIELVNYHLDK